MYSQTLDVIPIWLLIIAITVLFSIAVELGFRVGKFKHDRLEDAQNPQVSTILGASLGLLAFFMAFTFSMAGSRYDDRKKLVLDEVNTIETTYLRAQLLPEPYRAETRDLLRKYINLRAQLQAADWETVRKVIAESEKLHDLLWSKVVTLAENSNYSGFTGLFVGSLNDMFDLHEKRINAALRNRISLSIFLSLYLVAFLSMAMMGYQAGLGGRRAPIASFALVLTFAIVMTLITDLERPRQNIFSVSQKAMVDLQNKVGRTP